MKVIEVIAANISDQKISLFCGRPSIWRIPNPYKVKKYAGIEDRPKAIRYEETSFLDSSGAICPWYFLIDSRKLSSPPSAISLVFIFKL